jgi:hypothetical protein
VPISVAASATPAAASVMSLRREAQGAMENL